MPIQLSPSYHGYDVQDYRTVENDYGTMAEFKSFLFAAHERGIRVVIDYVMNHSSRDHPWFIESRNNINSDKRAWYVWEDNNPGYNGPWGQQVWHPYAGDYYYGLFWGGMPDLNYNSQELKDEMFDIADFWLNDVGVDGFRLDAVRYIYEENGILEDTDETISFWKDYSNHIKSIKGDAFSVGESWTATNTVVKYVEDGGLDVCFEFGLSSAIIDAINLGRSDYLYQKIQEVIDVYPHYQFASFLTNHDQDRSFEILGSNTNKSKLAASILLTLPGVPFLYYGEEVGMKGRKPDEFIRRPMQWTDDANSGFSSGSPWIGINSNYGSYNVETMTDDSNSLLSHYRNLIHIRNSYPSLTKGDFYPVFSDNNKVLSFIRSEGDEQHLVIINLSSITQSNIALDFKYSETDDKSYVANDLIKGDELAINVVNGSAQLPRVEAYQTIIVPLAQSASTADNGSNTSLIIYPNPTSEFLHLETSKKQISRIVISNAAGSICKIISQLGFGEAIDVSQLEEGIYFLQVYFNNGLPSTGRFVIIKD
jgi:glycosidase